MRRLRLAPLTETALALALPLATTPEQEVVLWCQRGWFVAMGSPVVSQDAGASAPVSAIIEGLGGPGAFCGCLFGASCPWHHGATPGAGNPGQCRLGARTSGAGIPRAAESSVQRSGSGHIRSRGTLEQTLGQGTSTASLPWQMPRTLALALETLLAWTTRTHHCLQSCPGCRRCSCTNPPQPWKHCASCAVLGICQRHSIPTCWRS